MSDGLFSSVVQNRLDSQSRRSFLTFSALLGATAAGGMLLKLQYAFADENHANASQSYQPMMDADQFSPNGFVEISTNGQVSLIMPKIEMGQGVYTSIPMLIAEELEVALEQVTLLHAPPNDALYADPMLGTQMTGGSTSIRTLWKPMREAGALCRDLLVTAAANHWNVDKASCEARSGVVYHPASNRRLAYGELAKSASTLPLPKNVTLKSRSEFKLVGKPVHRLDTPDKTNGKAKFGIDVRLPDMLYAALSISPVFGGKLKKVDARKALSSANVVEVLKLDNAVAVLATNTWAAKRGVDALSIDWDEGEYGDVNNAILFDELKKAANKKGAVATNEGDALAMIEKSKHIYRAEYQQPFLAHAAMEPINCTVHVKSDGSCVLWVGTQVPTIAQKTVANILNVAPEKVVIHNLLIGGAFGRRLEVDFIAMAVRFAKQYSKPIKFTWLREDDVQHDMYRPAYYDKLVVSLNDKGYPEAWSHTIAGSSILARYFPGPLKDGVDADAVEVAKEPPYHLPNLYVDYVRQEPYQIPTAFWRGVGATRGTFVVESFIDELAHHNKQDPLDYRLHLLDKTPRLKNIVQQVAKRTDWKHAKQNGRHLGLSAMHAFGSFLATVVDVSVNDNAEIKVNKVTCIVDCGMIVNPDTVKAQIEGGLIFGLTAALHGEIIFEHGRVQQSNFNNYIMMRMPDAPIIDVQLVNSGEAPGGIGEPGTAAVSSALTNAVFAATGKRIRKLPIADQLKSK